ncbi:MAG: sulfite exporter TauE/SafE family protein [Bacteroidetes bacterium]|nr:sulfite exporter TauE/SafE family protein [Bacteroidota bacterium]
MILFQAFLLGLFGSLHCAGMCGPIALALPVKQSSWGTRMASSLLYNSGRILTYAFLGFLLGLLGMGLFLWGVQRWVSIALGSIMILWVLLPFFLSRIQMKTGLPGMTAAYKKVFGGLFSRRTYFSVFIIGLLNGLLPCGLVYIALAGAVVSSGPGEGAMYMFLFGLGTVPVLLAVTVAGNIIGLKFRNMAKKFIPYFILLIGVLFILRGLNLGIPYISPRMEAKKTVPACCHGE